MFNDPDIVHFYLIACKDSVETVVRGHLQSFPFSSCKTNYTSLLLPLSLVTYNIFLHLTPSESTLALAWVNVIQFRTVVYMSTDMSLSDSPD